MHRLNRKKFKFTLIVLAVFWVLFIWSNSLRTAAESSVQSSVIVNILRPVLKSLKIPLENQVSLVRKIAHFSEFFILGLMLSAVFEGRKVLYPLSVSLSVAAVDETIQIFVPGRSFELSDILLDVTGALIAILIVWAGVGCFRKREERRAGSA